MQKIVKITLHGILGEQMNKSIWNLAVKSVADCSHALNVMSRKLFHHLLLENDKRGIKYEVLINKNPCLYPSAPDLDNPESILNSELMASYPGLETIDIVPIIEGAQDVAMVIAGVILVVIGAFAPVSWGITGPWAFALIMGGLGLIGAGLINLLSTPPKLEDFKGPSRKGSYLFGGPENTVGEGGPVPIVYGQLLVGSQTIATTYNITNQDAHDTLTV